MIIDKTWLEIEILIVYVKDIIESISVRTFGDLYVQFISRSKIKFVNVFVWDLQNMCFTIHFDILVKYNKLSFTWSS